MSLITVMLRAVGVPLHMELWLAAALGTHTWLIGFLAHLLLGGLIGLAYAVVFEWVIDSSGVGQGILLGAINTIFAGFGWAMIGGPGVFWSALGPAGVASLFLVHFVYGGVVGGLYTLEHARAYY
jgi:hypothetical protein